MFSNQCYDAFLQEKRPFCESTFYLRFRKMPLFDDFLCFLECVVRGYFARIVIFIVFFGKIEQFQWARTRTFVVSSPTALMRCGEKNSPKVTLFDNYTGHVGGKMGHLAMRR